MTFLLFTIPIWFLIWFLIWVMVGYCVHAAIDSCRRKP